ncbi:MAG: TSUP family transporter [Oscillospiraceae bacterium]|nr:TSUP family transporter [Oscillospiraceae bacterium]
MAGLKKHRLAPLLSGAAAGIANGLFGAGGGMLLLPLLAKTTDLRQHELFACSVCIILPLSLVSAGVYLLRGGSFLVGAVPYLIGGAVGGAIAGLMLKKLPTKWLHRVLGAFILWGGVRLLTA